MNYLPTCTSRLVEQYYCQVLFKSMQRCRRSWEYKPKCVKILSMKSNHSYKIFRSWIIFPQSWKSGLVVQHSCQVSFKSMQQCMVPTDHGIPSSRTFQGLLRYIFKEFSRTFLCFFKHPFVKKWSTMDFSNKTYRDNLILSSPEKRWWVFFVFGMCF